MNLASGPRGIVGKLRGRVDLGGIGDVDQMVGNAAPLIERELVSADVEATVHGGRVAADDFAAVALGQRQPKGALTRCRRAENGENERTHSEF